MTIADLISERYVDVGEALESGQLPRGAVLYLNPATYLRARKRVAEYARAEVIRFDGILFTSMVRLFLVPSAKRQSFDLTSLAPPVFRKAAATGQRVAFVGATQAQVDAAVAILSERFPGLNVVVSRSGYFSSREERGSVISSLVHGEVDLVVVGMGGVHQDDFALDLVEAGFRGTVHTCGGFLTQTANGGGEFYPGWVNRFNLRWLYRVFTEPRVIKRMVRDYPRFVLTFPWDVVRRSRTRRP